MKKFDFSGYATKNDLVCTDGKKIRKDAFKRNDGKTVPLVWQHLHNEPDNILGHALLENREDGVYAYGVFNDTPAGAKASALVKHGDITALSIYANQLKLQGSEVLNGAIREVSLVLSGANPGAVIDNLTFSHSDGSSSVSEDEAIIFTGLDITPESVKHAEETSVEKTVAEVFATFTEEQKNVVYAMIGEVLAGDSDEDVSHSDDETEGGNKVKKNVFDKDANPEGVELTHEDLQNIYTAAVVDAKKGGTLKDAFFAHAEGDYGITNIDLLFPDAQTLTPTPTFISRNMGWVAKVLGGTRHTPFSRIKSVQADITADEARAKGYVKAAKKTEEIISLLQRVTTPTTIYKKQKLDRDDIVDITDLDVVGFLKMEMRMMLDEEIARAVLVSDGRAADSADKIKEINIRPIYKDDEMYAHHVEVAHDADVDVMIDTIIRAREFYKGSGNPTMYTTTKFLTDMLLLKDTLGRRLFATKAELASQLLVNDIIEVPVMTDVTRTTDGDGPLGADRVMDLLAIIVNLSDYSIGADKGGAVNLFDDFDIDYNQYKYLMETRISGALVLPKSALVVEMAPAAGI
jgi:hypothetical protein